MGCGGQRLIALILKINDILLAYHQDKYFSEIKEMFFGKFSMSVNTTQNTPVRYFIWI